MDSSCYELYHHILFLSFNDGKPSNSFKPQRGLRQGCPLSFNLFILYAEALSSQLLVDEQNGYLISVPIVKSQCTISHLFFVVDNLVFCKATMEEWIRFFKFYSWTLQSYF